MNCAIVHPSGLWRIIMIAKIRMLLKKYREVILYLIMGVLATVVSIGTYELAMRVFHISALVANVISWIAAVSFAYFTNRNFVFEKTDEPVLKQAAKFFGGRVGTLVMEEILLWLLIYIICINPSVAKIIAQVFVLVANYIISKLFVFRKK